MVGGVLIGAVHAGRAEHVPLGGAADDERAAATHDLGRLAQDDLHDTWVAAVSRTLERLGRRLDIREIDDAPLGLRNRLLRHDEHVTVGKCLTGVGDGAEQQGGQIVARTNARGQRNRDDLDHASTAAARPVRTAGSFISVGATTARMASASSSAASVASSVSSTYAPASGCR